MKKQQIHNLIILDESGSMRKIARQVISGCNETMATIQSAQKQYADTQEHFVSIYVFSGRGLGWLPSRYLVKHQPVGQVEPISLSDYRPLGNTPLNDAVATTLNELQLLVARSENAVGNVTILTDGEENASKEYTSEEVAAMIDTLKEQGWSINLIGADIDVEATAHRLHVENSLEFRQSADGTDEMFRCEQRSRMDYYQRMHRLQQHCQTDPSLDESERRNRMREASSRYFRTDEKRDSGADAHPAVATAVATQAAARQDAAVPRLLPMEEIRKAADASYPKPSLKAMAVAVLKVAEVIQERLPEAEVSYNVHPAAFSPSCSPKALPVHFLFRKNGVPKVAVVVVTKNGYKAFSVQETVQCCAEQGIAYVRVYADGPYADWIQGRSEFTPYDARHPGPLAPETVEFCKDWLVRQIQPHLK